ncbi:FlxA-like family protein [Clostridium sp. WILCCON 0269]|uniref:FlxA-like family protein n=1 Tax=Candidatus Clostridium eludens TaxID=3381663 RepID=A0ABW8SHG4_9CLOT
MQTENASNDDEKTKQAKIKQLQTQLQQIEAQIQQKQSQKTSETSSVDTGKSEKMKAASPNSDNIIDALA